MKKLRKIENTFKSVLILKRINGQKRALNIQKRALNTQRRVRPHPTHPFRYATVFVAKFESQRKTPM